MKKQQEMRLAPYYQVFRQSVENMVHSWVECSDIMCAGEETVLVGPGTFRVTGFDENKHRVSWSDGKVLYEGQLGLVIGLWLTIV